MEQMLDQAVVRADEDLTEYLAETFPEVAERISFRTIYREKNIYLTRKYLKEHIRSVKKILQPYAVLWMKRENGWSRESYLKRQK